MTFHIFSATYIWNNEQICLWVIWPFSPCSDPPIRSNIGCTKNMTCHRYPPLVTSTVLTTKDSCTILIMVCYLCTICVFLIQLASAFCFHHSTFIPYYHHFSPWLCLGLSISSLSIERTSSLSCSWLLIKCYMQGLHLLISFYPLHEQVNFYRRVWTNLYLTSHYVAIGDKEFHAAYWVKLTLRRHGAMFFLFQYTWFLWWV